MKGIILAGGCGSRLYPITKSISKQLIPIYDKPMIYYPLSVLMLSEIKEILIISTPDHLPLFERMFGNGSLLGISIEYKVQESPKGLADAFLIAADFIGSDGVCLILGDNIFYGQGFVSILKRCSQLTNGARIFGYNVNNPCDFGVAEVGEGYQVLSLEEKPTSPKSNYAVPGLYYYDNSVVKRAKMLVPSARGELEITDLNKSYLEEGLLSIELLGRGFAWLDTGTHDGLANASDFVKTIQKRTGLYIACLEEIAYNNRWINKTQLMKLGKAYDKTEYGRYILDL